MNNCRRLYIGILLFALNPSLAVSAEVETKIDAYREIQKIEDSNARIVAELRLSLLGLPREAETNRLHLLENLQDFAEKSPDENLSIRVYLSRGHSPKELSALIDMGKFQSINKLYAKFVEGKLVTTLGLGGYDRYEGPTQRILEFLLYEHREGNRIVETVMASMGAKGPDSDIARISEIEDVQFYSLEGVLKARDADVVRQQYGELIMGVEIFQQRVANGLRFLVPPKEKLPSFDINKPAPYSISPGPEVKQMGKSVPVSSAKALSAIQ